jgi:pimeloyl-ACP methyl ester carboxylesterase
MSEQRGLGRGHAAVNGVNYYDAVYGKGEPLLLLHGGLGQIEMFGPNLTKLAQSRQVIGVDLHGHGRTALGKREVSIVDMGNDMADVLEQLGYDKVDVLGYSMGWGVGFQFAIQHPQMVRRLALASAGYSQDGFYPGWQREHMSQNRLAIIPNITHYEMGLAPELVDTALPFLNGRQ